MRARRLAAASVVLALGGALAMGCPDEELSIVITSRGAAQIFAGCQQPKTDCPDRTPPCGSGCEEIAGDCWRQNACRVEGHPLPRADAARQVRAFLFDPERGKIRGRSRCAALLPCDITTESAAGCLAESLNASLDGALPNGISFDDLEDPESALLFLAIYQTDETPSGAAGACRDEDLIACAGVTTRLGGDGTYDVTCAACQGGSRTPPAIDTGPCPRDLVTKKQSGCFLDGCFALLAADAE